MELTSIDYSRLIQYAAQKLHMVKLNKTQVNKILFYVYGVYLSETGKPLFNDDKPQAWTHGPVFPRKNKRINTDEIIKRFDDETVKAYKSNQKAIDIVVMAVNRMYNVSANSLTGWSHQDGSPWYNTIYEKDENGRVVSQKKWATPIEDSVTKSYFDDKKNRIFG